MVYWPPGLLIKPVIQWPGEPTPWGRRQAAPFRSNWSSTLEVLERELRVISAKAKLLQVDIAERYFRIDGYPRADAKANGPGVILTFDAFGGSLSYPCDTFDDWQDNVRAIALALEALRKVDRYGVTKRGEQYQGFKALPPGRIALGSAMNEADARHAIELAVGVAFNASDDWRAAFKRAQRNTHPDHGGHADDFDRVMQAGRVLGLVTS